MQGQLARADSGRRWEEDASLVELARRWSAEQPDQVAFRFLPDGDPESAEEVCYGALDRQARTIAGLLQQRLRPGDRALLLYRTSLDFIAAFLGCLYAEVIAVPTSPPRNVRQLPRLEVIAADAAPEVVLTSSDQLNGGSSFLAEGLARLDVEMVSTDTLDEGAADGWRPRRIDPESLAFLQYTSGSTADPKGVMVSHGNLVANEEMLARAWGHAAAERNAMACWTPLFHDMGLIGNVLQSLYIGAECTLMTPMSFLKRPQHWLQAISEFQATTAGAPDFAYEYCVRKVREKDKRDLDLSSWRVAFNAAEPVHRGSLEAFAEAFAPCGFSREALYPCYGLAEATVFAAGGSIAADPVYLDVERAGISDGEVVEAEAPRDAGAVTLVGCGRAWLDEEIRVVDPETREDLAEGQVGEIWLAGSNVAQGYWNKRDATERTFRATLASDDGETTFLRTGDMGFLDDGQLYLTGRRKDMIIFRGRNIHPEDVERQIQVRVGGVRPGRVAAFGVDGNGDGERLVVAAELRDPKNPEARSIASSIIDCVSRAHEVAVHDVALLPKGSIPKTTSGKIQRARCKNLYVEERLEPIVTWRSPEENGETSGPERDRSVEVEKAVRAIVGRHLGVTARDLDAEEPLTSRGVDSLRGLEICNQIEDELDVEVPLADLMGGASIGDLVDRAGGEGDATRDQVREPNRDQPRERSGPADGAPSAKSTADASFPLNDLQQAYWAGRQDEFALGGVAAHVYLELDGRDLNLGRLEAAWNRLIERHDVLRTRVLSEGTQQVLDEVPPYEIETADLRGEPSVQVERFLGSLRERMSHQVHPLDRWPLFEIRASELDGGRVRIHVSVDLFLVDGGSLLRLMDEWRRLYESPDAALAPVAGSFRAHVLEERTPDADEERARTAAEEYWRRRLPDLPTAPRLPRAQGAPVAEGARFRRRTLRLPGVQWSALKRRAREAGLTPAGLLLTAYSEVLGRWSEAQRFTLNVTHLQRPSPSPDEVPPVGQFASFDLLEVDRTSGCTLRERADELQRRLWHDLDHRQLGGVRLLRELARLRGRDAATMPVVFTAVLEDLSCLDWLGELVHGISQTPQVELDCQVFERSGDLVCQWDSVDEAFPPGVVDEMFGAFERLLRHLDVDLDDPDGAWAAAGDLSFVLPEDQRELIERINDTETPVPEALLQDLLTRQAAEAPDRIAVIDGATRLTFGALERQAAAWAARLLEERSTAPGSDADQPLPVALVLEKGWEQAVAALAVLRSGAPYAPLDAELPDDRLGEVLAASGARTVLTQERVARRHRFPGSVRVHAVEWLDDSESAGQEAREAVAPVTRPDAMACLLFTSGSTGRPKGVMVTHRGLVNAVTATNRRFEMTPDDRVLALTPFVHDMAGYDLFGVLAAGGAIVLPRAGARREPAHWVEQMHRHRVTLWNSVPAMLEMAVEYLEARDERFPDGLRLAFVGGDWIPLTLPERLSERLTEQQAETRAEGSAGATLVSVGGPTETTLWNIWYPVERVASDWRSIPYGAPIANTCYHVLDELLEERPVGVTGELWCAGVGVSAGYWRDEELTARRFRRRPGTGERIYGTGDLGRRRPDGLIEMVGRIDHQVQINGRRIEPGEIEAVLTGHPAVRQAVVRSWREDGRAPSLVAYVVAGPGSEPSSAPGTLSADALRELARRHLASYKVPARFVMLDELPLTPNGKIDRAALPEPRWPEERERAPAGAGSRAAGNPGEVERRLAAIVAEVLGEEAPSPDTDLAELGASSVEMIRIANRLEETFGSRPSVDELFQMGSIATLATYYREHRATAAAQAEAPAEAILVDPAERRAFRDSRPGLRTDLPPASVELPSAADEAALRESRRRRHSTRAFDPRPLDGQRLAGLLELFRSQRIGDRPRYLYASGGGLYPVQVYLEIRPGQVDGVDGGFYYYHPAEHRLYRLAGPAEEVDRSIHWPSNRATFDQAAFSLFLVASLAAIRPMYGERSLHFATLEAGLMSELLELRKPAGVGLCQIGDLDFDRVRPHLDLDEDDVLVHSLLGGGIPPAGDERGADDDGDGRQRSSAAPEPAEPGTPGRLARRRFTATNGGALPVTVLRPRARLSGEIDPGEAAPLTPPADAERVLVTGATGFLGAFLVERLLVGGFREVCCLVRAESDAAGRRRLEQHLRALDLWRPGFEGALRVFAGDLATPRFGLDRDAYRQLAGGIDAIFHNAARVNWVEPYRVLAPVNVDATKRLLRLATERRLKPVHFTSSLAVFPFRGIRFAEDDDLDHGHQLYGGYAQSKWVAERAVAAARGRGVPVAVYRPGLVSADTARGRYNGTAFLENLIKGSIQLGVAPRLPGSLDMVPVDFVAEAMARIARRDDSLGGSFHLTNRRTVTVEGLFRWLDDRGYPLELAPFRRWKSLLFEDAGLRENALYPYVGFLAELEEEQATMVPHDDTRTRGALGADLACPPVDDDYLALYVGSLVRSGFLAEPGSEPRGDS